MPLPKAVSLEVMDKPYLVLRTKGNKPVGIPRDLANLTYISVRAEAAFHLMQPLIERFLELLALGDPKAATGLKNLRNYMAVFGAFPGDVFSIIHAIYNASSNLHVNSMDHPNLPTLLIPFGK